MSHDARTPPVSVVIPAYNRAATIGAAIESVLRQTWADFELVVVDDGSTDGTLEAARAVSDPRLRVIAAPHNLGAAGARNLGVAEARGTWIAFQDSDDEWLPEKLAKQMARLAAPAPGGDWGGCYCGLLTVGGLDARPGERTRLRYLPDPAVKPAEGDIIEPLLMRNMISTQTLVVRRDLFLALGCFDEAVTPIEDWDFALRLAQRGPIAFVDEPLVHQRFSPNSITRGTRRRTESRARLVAKNMGLFASRPRRLAWQYYILASDSRKAGDLAAARRYLSLARSTHPADPRPWAMSLYVVGLSLVAPFNAPRARTGPRAEPGSSQ
jgi:glycosyltransferase involved in cell wall biosynthesis